MKRLEILTQGQGTERDRLTDSVLPRLYRLVQEHGVERFSFTKGFAVDTKVIPHADSVLKSVDDPDKKYAVTVVSEDKGLSLQIADYKVVTGTERTIVFDGNSFRESHKCQRNGPITIYEGGSLELSEEEQIAFLKEVAGAQSDLEAMKGFTRGGFTR